MIQPKLSQFFPNFVIIHGGQPYGLASALDYMGGSRMAWLAPSSLVVYLKTRNLLCELAIVLTFENFILHITYTFSYIIYYILHILFILHIFICNLVAVMSIASNTRASAAQELGAETWAALSWVQVEILKKSQLLIEITESTILKTIRPTDGAEKLECVVVSQPLPKGVSVDFFFCVGS
jgi:hypothetical protein